MIIAHPDKAFLAKMVQAIHTFIVSYFIYFIPLQKDTRNSNKKILSFDQSTRLITNFTTFNYPTIHSKNFP